VVFCPNFPPGGPGVVVVTFRSFSPSSVVLVDEGVVPSVADGGVVTPTITILTIIFIITEWHQGKVHCTKNIKVCNSTEILTPIYFTDVI
jgi:hypothetical protein